MIKSYTLSTEQVDIPEAAIEEILTQFSGIELLHNTAGILITYYEFADNGVVSALMDKLPFPIIGCTTFYQATPEASGLFELSLTILTSDDVNFALAYSNEAAQAKYSDYQEMIRDTYNSAFSTHNEKPAVILSFMSADNPFSGDEYLRVLDQASKGVKTFGVLNSGEDESGSDVYIFSDKEIFVRGFAMMLLIGEVKVGTYYADPPEERLLSVSAKVTSGEKGSVYEINKQPAVDYLAKNGIVFEKGFNEIMTSLPFYCKMPGDEEFVCRLLKGVSPNGSLEFMAEIPKDATLRVGTVTAEDILDESMGTVKKAAKANPDTAMFLIASCIGRYITLGLDSTAEMDHALSVLPEDARYLACYSAGEMCPVYSGNQMTNRFHNNSFVVLTLE